MRLLKSLLLFAICYLPIAAMAQGACYPGLVLLDTGRPANAASVRVCTQGSTGTPCTPAASLFSDPALSLPIATSPTLTTDSRGNFAFCATPANYDLQISGTGITTFKVSNLTLPAAAPITAATLTSSSASPATVGLVKLASGDCVDWRNNANTGNDQLCKTAAASGNVPADTLDLTAFGAVRALSWVSGTANPAASGAVALASGDCVKFRNNANSADLSGVCKNASDQVLLGSGPVIVPAVADTAALLGTAQSWGAVNQTNMQLVTPKIGGETVTAAPRMWASCTFVILPSGATDLCKLTFDKAVTILRIQGNSDNLPSCTTFPIFRVWDGTTKVSAAIAGSGALDSGVVATNLTAAAISIGVDNTWTCATAPSDTHVQVLYKMQ